MKYFLFVLPLIFLALNSGAQQQTAQQVRSTLIPVVKHKTTRAIANEQPSDDPNNNCGRGASEAAVNTEVSEESSCTSAKMMYSGGLRSANTSYTPPSAAGAPSSSGDSNAGN